MWTMANRFFKDFLPFVLFGYGLLAANFAFSQGGAVARNGGGGAPERTLTEWLVRLHDASRNRAYTGTLVVSAGNAISSARIWHVCDGSQQLERVDTLSGPQRTTVRRNNEVVTFMPESRLTVVEHRDSLGLFPALLQTPSHSLAEFYGLRQPGGVERVAGFDAEVVELIPRDDLRFGYRIWSEKKTGLVVKLQTLDAQQRVLEQVAFSELSLDTPVRMDQLIKMMKNRPGYTVQQLVSTRTTPEAQGWRLRNPVPGFRTVSFHMRSDASVQSTGSGAPQSLQWVFSDGLASASLFVEPYDSSRHGAETQMVTGATHSLSRRLDTFWLTAVGEVPPDTLRRFTQEMERLR